MWGRGALLLQPVIEGGRSAVRVWMGEPPLHHGIEGVEETPMNPSNMPVLIIVGCVCAAMIVMLWTLYETNGPNSMDALRKPLQTTGSSSPSNR